jgi:hypothetical protein
MRLSTLLSRNILRPDVGRLCNRFKIRSRRVVFFFEDILSLYIKECEEAGYKEEMERAGFEWGSLVFQELIPAYLKKHTPRGHPHQGDEGSMERPRATRRPPRG